MEMLNLELIKNLSSCNETVFDYIEQDFAKEILSGAEILGGKALEKAAKLEKYLGNSSSIQISTVAMMIDNIAKAQGKEIKGRVVIEAAKLTDAEYKVWQDDLAKSDSNQNEAYSAHIETSDEEIKLIKAENMNDSDAENYLYEMDANSVDSIIIEFQEHTRKECEIKLGLNS